VAFEGRFGALAGAYHAFRPDWPAEVHARVLARTPEPRRHAVDLGAGTGLVALWLQGEFPRVTAVEPDAAMLAHLPERPGLERLAVPAEEASFSAGSVDLVTIGNAFHWMERERVLELAHGWLRPGGALAAFRGDPPHAVRGPLRALLDEEHAARWRAHMAPVLLEPEGSRRALAASPFGPSLEVRRLINELTLDLAGLMGFLRSTSYAGGHARSLADPEAYWRDLEERVVATGGEGPYVLEFGIELLLANRAGGPA
jgi:SAM-dependent methyltransferase